MSNNYSVVGFWKGWHCSFNRWLVRYIFIPLGGSNPGRRWNVFVVFVFVAFWHDVEPKLFMWGMLNGVFLVLEVFVKELYRRSSVLESCRLNPLANRCGDPLPSPPTRPHPLSAFFCGVFHFLLGSKHAVSVPSRCVLAERNSNPNIYRDLEYRPLSQDMLF